jgi:hypothetical protein
MGVSGQRHAPAALLPSGKGSLLSIVQDAGWASEPVWTQRLEEKSFTQFAMMIALMMEAARTFETSVGNYFTRQYIPEDKSELHTRRRENLKSHRGLRYCSALSCV